MAEERSQIFYRPVFSLIIIGLLLLGLYALTKEIAPSKPEAPAPQNPTAPSVNLPADPAYLTVPEGFKINIFAENVAGARVIEFDPKGRVIVSQTKEGRITILEDRNSDGFAETRTVILQNLNKPHGLAWRCMNSADPEDCDLYVAEADELSRYSYDANSIKVGEKEHLADISYSSTDRHFTRSLLFLPSPNENILLISVGSSCNVCFEKDKQRGRIIAYNLKTGAIEPYAEGLRNAVFMTLNFVSGDVWATEMGRDNLGDNIPPDEINIIEKGKNYGWPICYGKKIHDNDFDKKNYIRDPCADTVASHVDLEAHSAPLGLSFVPEEGWPEAYWYNLLVAYHGSWNRSVPTGYKIVRIKLNAKGEYLGTEDFITGWLSRDGQVLGRPADIKILSGGTAYITDDDTGRVYRLTRSE